MSQSEASHEDLVDLAETLQPCTAQGPHQQQETVEHEVHIEHQWFHQSGPSQVSLHWRRDSQVAGYNNGGCDKQKVQGPTMGHMGNMLQFSFFAYLRVNPKDLEK